MSFGAYKYNHQHFHYCFLSYAVLFPISLSQVCAERKKVLVCDGQTGMLSLGLAVERAGFFQIKGMSQILPSNTCRCCNDRCLCCSSAGNFTEDHDQYLIFL